MDTKIKFITPELVVSDSMAIVASSGRLKYNVYGPQIDSFDEVVRFNRAPTKGYEHIVGEKTTIRVANNHVFGNVKLNSQEWSDQPQYFIKNLRDTKILYFGPDLQPWRNRSKNTHSSCDLYLFDFKYSNMIKKYFGFNPSSGKNFSIGFGVVAVAIMSGINPHIFGFDVEVSKFSARDHYWENRPPPGNAHCISEEARIILELADKGKIRLYL